MKRALLLFSILAASEMRGEDQVVGGPYAVNVGPRSATVMWVVQTGEVSLRSALGNVEKTVPVLRAEKAIFTGLEPGTTYTYQAFSGGAGKGSFKTPPAGEARFQFVVYGDTRTRHEVHRNVVAAILRYAQPDFVIHTGDLTYDGNDPTLWPIFFGIERELLRKTAFYPALGNHENGAASYFDFLSARSYYSFNWGSAHFTVIDSDIESAGTTPEERDAFWQIETRWLEADLRGAQDAQLRFVFAHHPPMTAVKGRPANYGHMTALEPMFEKYRVSAGFFGHDHNYQHYLKDGLHYFISGGGGAPLYDVDSPPAGITQKVAKTENFLIVQVDGNKARVEARTPDGEVLDTAELDLASAAGSRSH
jgi:predicted phosphodiesterase